VFSNAPEAELLRFYDSTPLAGLSRADTAGLALALGVLLFGQGRPRVTPYWPDIYRQIIDTNPSLEAAMRPYEPGRRA
jgi:hypothetical protein